jgi:predicted alpha/beta superfamily hydrolase
MGGGMDMTVWRPYERLPESTVVGTLLVSTPLLAQGLDRSVELLAWIPPGTDEHARLPVLYMHDGDNLFDEPASHTGEWCVDETLESMGRAAIVVGIPNAGDRRMHEYCPWPNHFTDDVLGDTYARFVVDQVVPFIDETLPTRPDRSQRGVMGSSLGGLISLYCFLAYPETFGFVGSMSTAAWWTPGLWPFLDDVDPPPGRVYLDVGTDEMPMDPFTSHAYVDSFHRLRTWCIAAGYGTDLLARVEPGATHIEVAWASRLPEALAFLLPEG